MPLSTHVYCDKDLNKDTNMDWTHSKESWVVINGQYRHDSLGFWLDSRRQNPFPSRGKCFWQIWTGSNSAWRTDRDYWAECCANRARRLNHRNCAWNPGISPIGGGDHQLPKERKNNVPSMQCTQFFGCSSPCFKQVPSKLILIKLGELMKQSRFHQRLY